MGLDMYLTARKFLWVFHDGSGDDAEAAKKIREIFPEMGDMRPSYVSAEAAYWRKANAIHGWFVRNVQDGEDNCGYYYVSREKLGELVSICNEILDDPEKASELLPTESGFFFGGTEYGEYYTAMLTYTRDRIGMLLGNPELEDWEFQYHSSW